MGLFLHRRMWRMAMKSGPVVGTVRSWANIYCPAGVRCLVSFWSRVSGVFMVSGVFWCLVSGLSGLWSQVFY